MLRLTESPGGEGETILRVDGWLDGDYVELLEREGALYLAAGGSLVLDLGGLRFADRAGIELLLRWSRAGVQLRNPSPFVQRLLDDNGGGVSLR